MRLILIALICLSFVEAFSQTKFSLDPFERKSASAEEILDPFERESAKEIHALIENGGEASLILDKCVQHRNVYRYYLQKCSALKDSVEYQQRISEITALLISNNPEKLGECIDKCEKLSYVLPKLKLPEATDTSKVTELCEKQLVSKIKKLPLKKITSEELAKIYFHPLRDDNMFPYTTPMKNGNVIFTGKVIQNTGKIAILTHPSDIDFMVKHSGQCILRENQYFQGIGKYIGETTYNTILGKRTVPAVQLLWCENPQ